MDIKFYIALVQFFVSVPSNMKKMSECAKMGFFHKKLRKPLEVLFFIHKKIGRV